jgi:hypothetical protein
MIRPDNNRPNERRSKTRFPIHRELRYKLLEDDVPVESGMGETIDMASGGIAFQIEHSLRVGAFVELSISWPVLLDDSCAMRLIVFGRIVRSSGKRSACRVDKYEFRTQARVMQPVLAVRNDSMLQRFAVSVRKETMKAAGF